MHKHTSVCIDACTHAHSNFTLTWNSVVLRMWRPSGLQREETKPIEPSSILQCQSGCSRDHTWRARQRGEGERQKYWDQPLLITSLAHILKLISISEKHLTITNHEGLALDTPSKVRYLFCDTHKTVITLACRTFKKFWNSKNRKSLFSENDLLTEICCCELWRTWCKRSSKRESTMYTWTAQNVGYTNCATGHVWSGYIKLS